MVTTSGDTTGTGSRPASSARVATAVLVGVLGLAVVVLTARLVFGHWLAFSDWAVIELRTRDVGTSHTPLVGPYSRYGWNHPGPLLYFALALPYRLLGSEGTGILFGALLVNTASLALIGVVLWRRGHAFGLAIGGAVVLLLVRALHAEFLVNPWNPFVILLPMLAVVLLAWAATDGDQRWALPTAIGVGSLAVQSHVGAAAAVIVTIAVAIVWCLFDARRTREWRAFGITMLASLVVGLFCWMAPIAQQFRSDGGNLSDLREFWTQSHASVTGWSAGAKLVGAQLTLPASWFTGHETRSSFTGGIYPGWHVPIALLLLVVAFVVAVRRADRSAIRLCTFALALIGAGWIAASRVIDEPYYYVVQWLWIVGAVAWLAIAWTLARALPAPSGAHRVVAGVATAAVAVLAIALLVESVRDSFPNPSNDETVMARFAPAARTALRGLAEPVLIEAPPDLRSRTFASGVLILAEHAGIDAGQLPDLAYAVGASHTVAEDRAGSTVLVTVDDAGDRYRTDPKYHVLASFDPLTPAERAELAALRFEAFAAQQADGSARWVDAHEAEQARMEELQRRGSRVELFEEVSTQSP